jgi:hypothetical protein
VQVPGYVKMEMTVADNGDVTIAAATGSTYAEKGKCKLVNDADERGNKKCDAIHISYQWTSGVYSYAADDTLVIMDRAEVMELFTPKFVAP